MLRKNLGGLLLLPTIHFSLFTFYFPRLHHFLLSHRQRFLENLQAFIHLRLAH